MCRSSEKVHSKNTRQHLAPELHQERKMEMAKRREQKPRDRGRQRSRERHTEIQRGKGQTPEREREVGQTREREFREPGGMETLAERMTSSNLDRGSRRMMKQTALASVLSYIFMRPNDTS